MGGTTTLSDDPIALGDGSYGAQDFRRATLPLAVEGVLASGDALVSERAAGANMSVDVAAATGVIVTGDSVTSQGNYFAYWSSVQNVTITAADGSNPRIDRIVVEIKDDDHDSSGITSARLRAVDGTPSAGATLANLTGAAAVPSSCVLIANVLVGTGDTAIDDAEIDSSRDVRAMAVPLSNQPACRLYNSANTSATTATWTKVALNTSTHDNGGMGDLTNNRIYARTAGLYSIKGSIHFAASTGGALRWVAIYKNGSAITAYRGNAHLQSGVKQTAQTCDELNLAAGDYIELYGYQDSGGNLNLLTEADSTWLSVRRVGETVA